MKAVIQRVTEASVVIDNRMVSKINTGLLLFVGFETSDNSSDIEWLSKKIVNLRIFGDEDGVMNRSVLEANGDVLVVSQFTLHASTKKGNRPSYIKAARPEIAIPLYEQFIAQIEKDLNKRVGTGTFGADMNVNLVNDGPVTIIIDSQKRE